MSSESRNTRVVVALILFMSIGAVCLMFLERRPDAASRSASLTATTSLAISTVELVYVVEGRSYDPAAFDALVFPDGRYRWTPSNSHVRVGVIGLGAPKLPDEQRIRVEKLLTWLRSRGLDSAQLACNSLGRVQTGEFDELRRLCDATFDAR